MHMNKPNNSSDTSDQGRHSPRFLALEEQLLYQQRALDQLHSVMLEQQAELERLRADLRSLQRTWETLLAQYEDGDLPHEKPPHY